MAGSQPEDSTLITTLILIVWVTTYVEHVIEVAGLHFETTLI